MIDAAPGIFVALEQSGFAAAIRQSPWLYPAANVGHIVSLTFFAGAIARAAGAPWRRRRVIVAQCAGVVIVAQLQPSRTALALHCLNLQGYEVYCSRLRELRVRDGGRRGGRLVREVW